MVFQLGEAQNLAVRRHLKAESPLVLERLKFMSDLVTYDLDQGVAILTMDDGKANAMSIDMLGALHRAFDQAEEDGAVVLLTGRTGIFSAGFDLAVFKEGPGPLFEMMRSGAELTERILSFPTPVVTACNGHAYPMGAFLMLSADLRFGTAGSFRIGMNEVAVGLTVPYFAIALARHRLSAKHFHRTVVLAELFSPEDAVSAGFLDHVIAEEDLFETSHDAARSLTKLDPNAHKATKLRARKSTLKELRAAIEGELTLDKAKDAKGPN